jgi:hypothetical protein
MPVLATIVRETLTRARHPANDTIRVDCGNLSVTTSPIRPQAATPHSARRRAREPGASSIMPLFTRPGMRSKQLMMHA